MKIKIGVAPVGIAQDQEMIALNIQTEWYLLAKKP